MKQTQQGTFPSRSDAPKSSRVTTVLFSALFALTLTFRLIGISTEPVQTDERHWVKRSAKVVQVLLADPFNATTHLTHPGLPPAVAMSLGQILGDTWNERRGLSLHDRAYVFKLHSSRIMACLLSALIVPLVFFGLRECFGDVTALLSAALIAFDPIHIGSSRMAHLDGVQSLLIVTTVLLYALATERASLKLKLLAGLFWGLSLLTKATAVILIPAFLIYSVLYHYWWLPRSGKPARKFSLWGDVGAVLVGHLVFAALYTRMWHHDSDYRVRLHISSEIADIFWKCGELLREYWVISVVLVFTALIIAWKGERIFCSRLAPQKAKWIGSIAASVFLVLLIVPQVPENFARYWTWVLSLSSEEHQLSHLARTHTVFNYFDLFVLRAPAPLRVGLLLFCLVMPFLFLGKTFQQQKPMIFLLFICSVIWIAFLSLPHKRAWRYALPVLPFLYVLSAFAFFAICRFLTSTLKFSRLHTGTYSALAVGVAAIQLATAYSSYPQFLAYYNHVFGGLAKAVAMGIPAPLMGHDEAVKLFLDKKPKDKSLVVSMIRDSATLAYACVIQSRESPCPITFGYFRPSQADYMLSFESDAHSPFEGIWHWVNDTPPIFDYYFEGVKLYSIWEVPMIGIDKAVPLPIWQTWRDTGHTHTSPSKKIRVAMAKPEKDKEGYIFVHPGFRLKEGDFELQVPLTHRFRTKNGEKLLMSPIIQRGVRIELGDNCKREISAEEIFGKKNFSVSLICHFDSPGRKEARVYWYGEVPIHLTDPTLRPTA